MCTPGCRLVHFRGRYYHVDGSSWDCSPNDYGSKIVNEITIDPEEYQEWLAKQRAKASEWASALEKFLHVKRPAAKETDDQEFDDQLSETASEVSERALRYWNYDIRRDVKSLPLPSYIPVFNSSDVKWVYVIDLDREIFSVDHGAHFNLGYIPRPGWIDALDKTCNGYRLVLPDLLPDSAVSSLVVRPDPPDVQLIRLYEGLGIEIVTPDGINGFHQAQRHEPLF